MGQFLADAEPVQLLAREGTSANAVGQMLDADAVGDAKEGAGHVQWNGVAARFFIAQGEAGFNVAREGFEARRETRGPVPVRPVVPWVSVAEDFWGSLYFVPHQ